MGQTLSFPATEKHSASGENKRFAFGLSEMQGWRINMEDAHAAVLDLDFEKEDSNGFFAVYDGHGGSTIAKYAGSHLHRRLAQEEAYKERRYDIALKKAFLAMDEEFLADASNTRDSSGCTAVAALVTSNGEVYVANAGDSRSVISVKGEVKPLSFDHKPTNESERERIRAAGGYVEYGRVNGNLALSRALGDFDFKKNYELSPEKQIITANPEVTCHEITEEDEFLVLACDGIWDCLTSQQVVDFVRFEVAQGKPLQDICEAMCDLCLAPDTSSGAGTGCDNMTVLIVALLGGRTKEEWYSWVGERMRTGYGYRTPSSHPQLYSQTRLMSFRARLQAGEEKKRTDRMDAVEKLYDHLKNAYPGVRVFDIGPLMGRGSEPSGSGMMFGHDEDDSGDEFMSLEDSPSETDKLKAQLSELEADSDAEPEYPTINIDSAASTRQELAESHPPSAHLQGEAPPPPKRLPNGDAVAPVKQLKSLPHGDEPLPVVKAEGLSDTSEGPLT